MIKSIIKKIKTNKFIFMKTYKPNTLKFNNIKMHSYNSSGVFFKHYNSNHDVKIKKAHIPSDKFGELEMSECDLFGKIKRNGALLQFVSKDILTYDMCYKAVKQHGSNIKHVLKKILDYDICFLAISQQNCGKYLKYVPYKQKTKELCLEALYNNNEVNDLFNFVPRKYFDDPDFVKACCEYLDFLNSPSINKIKKEFTRDIYQLKNVIFGYIPEMYKTNEFFFGIIEKHPQFWNDMPDEYKTREMWEKIVRIDPTKVKYMSHEYMTFEMCVNAVKIDGEILVYLPDKFKNEELCTYALSTGERYLFFVPEKLRTREFCLKACIMANGKTMKNILEYVPEDLKDREFYLKIIEYNPEYIDYIPESVINKEFCEYLFECDMKKNDGFPSVCDSITSAFYYLPRLNFEYIPDKYKTKKMCERMISKLPLLQYVPEHFKDREMCEKAIELDGYQIQFVLDRESRFDKVQPEPFITRDLCVRAIDNQIFSFHNMELLDDGILPFIPRIFRDENICDITTKQSYHALKYVPDHIKDYDFCYKIILRNGLALKYVPNYIKDYDMCMKAVKQTGYALEHVPDEFMDYDMCLEAVTSSCGALKHVPELYRYDSEIIRISNDWTKSFGLLLIKF